MPNMAAGRRLIDVCVHAIGVEAEGILSFDLRSIDGDNLPPFSAGSHIDVHLTDTLERSYSLINPVRERHRYQIAVARASQSTGGSKYICDVLKIGDRLQVSEPRNNFPLEEAAPCSV